MKNDNNQLISGSLQGLLIPTASDAPSEANKLVVQSSKLSFAADDGQGSLSWTPVALLGEDPYYPFSSFTFSTNIIGRTGPTLAGLRAYAGYAGQPWLNNTAWWTVTGGIQRWVVPSTGRYRITAQGASGYYGRAAIVTATYDLRQGDVLKMLIGQYPTAASWIAGSGGTFVICDRLGPLVIAGGAGGSVFEGQSLAVLTNDSTFVGGRNSDAGSTLYGYGGGGAGYQGNAVLLSGSITTQALSYVNGGAGGTVLTIPSPSSGPTSVGGFGGGGAAFQQTGSTSAKGNVPAGGGGASGGNSGAYANATTARGGIGGTCYFNADLALSPGLSLRAQSLGVGSCAIEKIA